MPHRFVLKHNTRQVFLGCSDFRLKHGTRRVLRCNDIDDADYIYLPGGAKALSGSWWEAFRNLLLLRRGALFTLLMRIVILISVVLLTKLHNAEEVVITNHQACGAYGLDGHKFDVMTFSDEERAFHLAQLQSASTTLRRYLDRSGLLNVQVRAGVLWVGKDDTLFGEDTLHIEWIS